MQQHQIAGTAPSSQQGPRLGRFICLSATSASAAGMTAGGAVASLAVGGGARISCGVVAAACLIGCGWAARANNKALTTSLEGRSAHWLRLARQRADAARWAVLSVALILALACLVALSGRGAVVWGTAGAVAVGVAAATCWVWVGKWRARARDAEIRAVQAQQFRAQALHLQTRQNTAATLRMTLLRSGFESLTPVHPGTTVLRAGEVVHLTDLMHFSRLDTGLWVAAQWCPVLVTNERIVARTQTAGELSFWWDGVTAIVPTAYAVELHFDVGIPLRLDGDSAELVSIYATARCRGIAALNP